MLTLREKLKQVRLEENLSARQVAEDLGTDFSRVYSYEHEREQGGNNPSSEYLIKFCEKYNVSIQWLLEGGIDD